MSALTSLAPPPRWLWLLLAARAPDPDRCLLIETPWRARRAGLLAMLRWRYPCHDLAGQSESAGMILWRYQRQPGCTREVPR